MKIRPSEPADGPGCRYLTLKDLWRKLKPSRATRAISRRSRGSSRALIAPQNLSHEIACESALEFKFVQVALTRSDVVDIWDQPPRVNYRDSAGKLRGHTFDFLVTMADGARVAVEIKPYEKVVKYGWRALIAAIGKQNPKFADRFILVTEKNLPAESVYNARLFLACNRGPHEEHDEQMRALVANLNGRITIADLVAQSGLDGDGFRSLVRLISAGHLIVHGRGRIDHSTFVSVPGVSK